MSRGLFLLVLVIGLGAPSASVADLTAVFDVHLERTAPSDLKAVKGNITEEKTKARVTLRLGLGYIEYEDGNDAELIDFRSRLVTDRLKKEGQYVESPLLSRIGFMSAEFNNRLMLAGVLSAGGIKDNPMDSVLVEHLFSLRAPNSPHLTGQMKGKTESWQHGDKPLFSCETDGCKLTVEETRFFLQYLRYRFGIHPDILAACAKREAIPNRMEIYRYNMQVEHYSFSLVKYQRISDSLDRTKFLANTTKKQEGIVPLCEKAGQMSEASFQAACVRLKDKGMAQRDAGHIFDAILLLMEYGLCSDHLQPADLSAMKDALKENEYCRTLFASLAPTSKENAEQCVKDLQALEAKTEKGTRVLKIFRANILSSLGHSEEAKTLLIDALTENAANAGAWKDLGDIFYNEYEMPTAWQCWNVTRHLLSTHKNFRPVLDLEKHLVETYPEFL